MNTAELLEWARISRVGKTRVGIILDNESASIAAQVIRLIHALPDNASLFHRVIEYHLHTAGFTTAREVECHRESGRAAGRLDLVAEYDGGFVGMEFDHRKPRTNSLDKLREWGGGRIIVLRRDPPFENPQGIDYTICVPVVAPLDVVIGPGTAARMARER